MVVVGGGLRVPFEAALARSMEELFAVGLFSMLFHQ